jgi:hypothetical protein
MPSNYYNGFNALLFHGQPEESQLLGWTGIDAGMDGKEREYRAE